MKSDKSSYVVSRISEEQDAEVNLQQPLDWWEENKRSVWKMIRILANNIRGVEEIEQTERSTLHLAVVQHFAY